MGDDHSHRGLLESIKGQTAGVGAPVRVVHVSCWIVGWHAAEVRHAVRSSSMCGSMVTLPPAWDS